MGGPVSMLILAIIATILAIIVVGKGNVQEIQDRYLRNGNWYKMPDNDEGIYNLLLNLQPTDFIMFPHQLPTFLETVLQEGFVNVGNAHLKKEDYKNLDIISDDKGNLWSIVECGHPIISFMIYSVDGDDIEYIDPENVDFGRSDE